MRRFLMLLGLLTGVWVMAENNDANTPPRGGVCFRMDDNQTPEKWQQIAEVFNRHQAKFCASLNLGSINRAFLPALKQFQEQGHEIMDHTPLHDVTRFNFAPGKKDSDYRNLPGVDHISGRTVFLSYRLPEVGKMKIKEWSVNIDGDKLTLSAPADEKVFKKISRTATVYLPERKVIYRVARTDSDRELKLSSVWRGGPAVREAPGAVKAYLLSDRQFAVTPEGLKLLGQNSMALFAAAGLKRPDTWIQPGGGISNLSAEQAQTVLGKELGYKSAATYVGSARKVFGEYDPKQACAYGMMWGDFDEEGHDLSWNKTRIADRVALHHMVISHSHMKPRDGWAKYLQRLDQLLAWCKEQRIPIRTQAEWADILYRGQNRVAAGLNVFPALNTDRDGNGRPDGYTLKNGAFDRDKNAIAYRKAGEIFAVKGLSGLPQGPSRLTFRVHSTAPARIKVLISFPGAGSSLPGKIFALKGGNDQLCSWNFNLPETASVADFTWQALDDGPGTIDQIGLCRE